MVRTHKIPPTWHPVSPLHGRYPQISSFLIKWKLIIRPFHTVDFIFPPLIGTPRNTAKITAVPPPSKHPWLCSARHCLSEQTTQKPDLCASLCIMGNCESLYCKPSTKIRLGLHSYFSSTTSHLDINILSILHYLGSPLD